MWKDSYADQGVAIFRTFTPWGPNKVPRNKPRGGSFIRMMVSSTDPAPLRHWTTFTFKAIELFLSIIVAY